MTLSSLPISPFWTFFPSLVKILLPASFDRFEPEAQDLRLYIAAPFPGLFYGVADEYCF